jgi:putative DNA primase/helicase
MEQELQIVEKFLKNKVEGTYLLAEYIVNKYNIITIGEKEREMFVYDNGQYIPAESHIIFPEIQRILGHFVRKNDKMETYHKIADMTAYSRDIFNSADLRYIPLKNGVYDINTHKLLPHNPKYRFMYQFPIVYSSEATCPRIEAFLNQVLNPTQRLIVEEWIGYYFLRNYMFKKAIIFVGEGDTGKTTLLDTIINMLGIDNVSAVPLNKMTKDKFSAAHLFQKHGNICDELSASDIQDTGAFKMATGGGSMMGEHKFGNQFSFKNYAKFTFACNKIPEVKDTDDEAYFNRWMVIRLENTIEKKIPNFINTLTTQEEISGLFNLAMKGLTRLLEQQRFTYNFTAIETKTEMMRSGSSIATFVSDMIEPADGSEISKEDMYEEYTKYCKKNNLSSQTKDMLGKKLTGFIPYISEGLITENGKRVRGWRNAKIKGKEVKKEEDVDWGDFKSNNKE